MQGNIWWTGLVCPLSTGGTLFEKEKRGWWGFLIDPALDPKNYQCFSRGCLAGRASEWGWRWLVLARRKERRDLAPRKSRGENAFWDGSGRCWPGLLAPGNSKIHPHPISSGKIKLTKLSWRGEKFKTLISIQALGFTSFWLFASLLPDRAAQGRSLKREGRESEEKYLTEPFINSFLARESHKYTWADFWEMWCLVFQYFQRVYLRLVGAWNKLRSDKKILGFHTFCELSTLL